MKNNIQIQYVKIPVSESLTQYIEEKSEKLFAKYSWITNAQVSIKKEDQEPVNKCICDMELSAPGPRIFASSKEKNFEMAVKNTLSDLEDQLKKRKHKFVGR